MSIAIINRDFGEHAGAIGLGLNRFAIDQALASSVSVITLSSSRDVLALGEKANVKLFLAKSLTSSGSSIAMRLSEVVYFSLFVVVSLIKSRPKLVYVTSNPPVIIPFFVFIFCYFTKSKYIYHVQDIHPEASSIVFKMPKILIYLIRSIDTLTLKNAELVITLSKDMKATLLKREKALSIRLLQNPAIVNKTNMTLPKTNGAIFCGNAGRLQNIDILLDAIEIFLGKDDSDFIFGFVGRGVFSSRLSLLSEKYKRFKYYGYVSAEEALAISTEYKWALLPIRGEVLQYAYPSKIPTYISAGCQIISITSGDTELAREIHSNDLGFNVEANVGDIVAAFESLPAYGAGFSGFERYAFIKTDEFGNTLSNIAKSIGR
jgi:hypothetical protein